MNLLYRFGHIPLWWFRPLSVLVLGASEGCWALVRSTPPVPNMPAAAHAQTNDEHVAWSAHALGAAVGVPLAFIVFTGNLYFLYEHYPVLYRNIGVRYKEFSYSPGVSSIYIKYYIKITVPTIMFS